MNALEGSKEHQSDNQPWRPLHGVRVLDLTAMLPGPFASQVLVDLGATVIKVERPPKGEAMRTLQPFMFDIMNRGKHSIAVDLKSANDVELLLDLAVDADVVMEGFRPGVLDRAGVGFEAITRARAAVGRPGVVYVSLSGWGQDGPLANDPGHNGTFVARTGATFLTGEPGAAPSDSFPVPLGDLGAALYSVIGILAALRTPEAAGVHLNVSMFASALNFMTPRLAEFAGTGAKTREDTMVRPANGVFACSDGYILIAAVEDHFWPALCSTLGLNDLASLDELRTYSGRFARVSEINERIGAQTAQRRRDDLVADLRESGVPVSPVLAPDEVAQDPQVRFYDFFPDAGDYRSFLPISGVHTYRPNDPTGFDSSGPAIRTTGWDAVS